MADSFEGNVKHQGMLLSLYYVDIFYNWVNTQMSVSSPLFHS